MNSHTTRRGGEGGQQQRSPRRPSSHPNGRPTPLSTASTPSRNTVLPFGLFAFEDSVGGCTTLMFEIRSSSRRWLIRALFGLFGGFETGLQSFHLLFEPLNLAFARIQGFQTGLHRSRISHQNLAAGARLAPAGLFFRDPNLQLLGHRIRSAGPQAVSPGGLCRSAGSRDLLTDRHHLRMHLGVLHQQLLLAQFQFRQRLVRVRSRPSAIKPVVS